MTIPSLKALDGTGTSTQKAITETPKNTPQSGQTNETATAITTTTAGWEIGFPILEKEEKSGSKIEFKLQVAAKGSSVAVLGLYNRGKTWLISKLCDIKLEHSYFKHTEGISFVVPNTDLGKNLFLIDTAGSQKAVEGIFISSVVAHFHLLMTDVI